ncbi:galactose-specific cell agglutination protein gsf2-like [Pomacea canaliculata]|uniref:galactose-specific cell agglutination protein gsf2-like n=1 Tax=Pomacea canaliculata TaxID=400727 RepID=UPI000D730F6E|nr:galactose-specific cell agglutination protein gsf2-like [Pomacea canaliculata]
MPVVRGWYTYSFAINPPQPNFFAGTIEVVPPGEPHHDCPEVVNEQSTVSCKCTSLNPGTPPAEIVWDGMFDNSNTLLIQTVEQQSTVNSYTCRLTWGPKGFINRTVVYTFKIVGPVTSGTTDTVISGTTATVISGTTGTLISGTTGTATSGTTGTVISGTTGPVTSGTIGTVISGTTGTATPGTTGTATSGTTATVISGTKENKPSAGSAVLIGTTVGVLAALVIIIFIILMIIRLKCPVYCKAKRPFSEEHTYDDIADVEQSPHYDRLTRQETGEHHYETAANGGGNCSQTADGVFVVPATYLTVCSPER